MATYVMRSTSCLRVGESAAKYTSNKELRQLVRVAEGTPNCVVKHSRGGHLVFRCPDGSSYFTGSTPSSYSGLRNLRADLKKRGLNL